MKTIFVARPLDHEIAHWLARHGVDCPAGQSGRNPNAAEIRAALGEMPDIRYHQSPGARGAGWQIDVMDRTDLTSGRWTSILSDAAREDRAPIAFHRGWSDLIVEITYRVSARTGPLVLFPSTGATPLPVWAGRSLLATLNALGPAQ